jgi:dolichol kinase
MVTQKNQEVKERVKRPRIVPIEGVLWVLLSLLCWSNDWFSIVASVTTLHLIIRIYFDIMRNNMPMHDQRFDDPRIWRYSSTTISNTNFEGSDGEGKYLSIALIPILLESMNILSKQQNQEIRSGYKNVSVNDYNHVSSYWHSVALIVSILQIFTWNMDSSYYMNNQNFWKQQKPMLNPMATVLMMLLLLLSYLNTFQKLNDELWFCFFWINTALLFGPFYHSSLQGIMTCGEWSVISCCFALVGTSIWTAVVKDMKYFIINHNSNNILRNEIDHPTSAESTPTVIYAYTATAGVLGCILACSTVNRLFQYKNTNEYFQQIYPNFSRFCHSSVITNTIRIMYISFITLGIVEYMFWYFNLTPRHTFPKCLWWIFNDFLFAIENSSFASQVESQGNADVTLWFPIVTKLPRLSWLIYWFTTMLATIPLAPTTGQLSPVIARKWFHFIAILLFVPTTVLVPQLQSLSYAVAICVLLIIEVIRIDIPILNDFYYAYLDQTKDEADDSKFVISHIALVAGCAMPLWIIQYYNYFCPSENMDSSLTVTFNVLVGLWGVWVLGIGDAMGAIIGKSFGRNQWGSNSRTMEGSMAMFLSMCLSCLITTMLTSNTTMYADPQIIYFVAIWLPAVFFVTLIEAYTLQIDNIVLPFAGATMIFVCQATMMKVGFLS